MIYQRNINIGTGRLVPTTQIYCRLDDTSLPAYSTVLCSSLINPHQTDCRLFNLTKLKQVGHVQHKATVG